MDQIHFLDNISEQNFKSLLNKYSSVFLLFDKNTFKCCYPLLPEVFHKLPGRNIIIIDSGENFKSVDSCNLIWQTLLKNNADRKSVLINIGGGMICDLGGFAASTFKRGINFINIPTSLLAMVDAAIGGKTGINISELKNQVGTFTNAEEVYIYPKFLESLDIRQLQSAYGEIVKYALIHSIGFFESLETSHNFQSINTIQNCIAIKNKIVSIDPHEKGLRKVLNFGHTFGHALESCFLNTSKEILHGEAVAIGILIESIISTKILDLSFLELDRIKNLVFSCFDKFHIDDKIIPELLEFMMSDKKNESGEINFTLLNGIGKPEFDHYISKEQIVESIKIYQNL